MLTCSVMVSDCGAKRVIKLTNIFYYGSANYNRTGFRNLAIALTKITTKFLCVLFYLALGVFVSGMRASSWKGGEGGMYMLIIIGH